MRVLRGGLIYPAKTAVFLDCFCEIKIMANGHGGAGRGQGRKRNPAKALAPVGEDTAFEFLNSLGRGPKAGYKKGAVEELVHNQGHVEEMRRLYYEAKCAGQVWTAAAIIFKNREWAFGKPVQVLKLGNDQDKPLKVDVTSARDKLAAKLLS